MKKENSYYMVYSFVSSHVLLEREWGKKVAGRFRKSRWF
jgi:hypothetical protein